jgi:ornithine carbamoyltransferase
MSLLCSKSGLSIAMTKLKHFLDLHHFDHKTLRGMLKKAAAMKKARSKFPRGTPDRVQPLKGKVLALVFERPSTRTRVSFEMAMRQLGGTVIVLSASETQLGRGESIADTARVLSRYVDGIMLRASSHEHLNELAKFATVPVINGLTSETHPCQVMADIMTLEEHCGPISKQKVAWVGDGNNVVTSWVHAVAVLGGELAVGCPDEYPLPQSVVDFAKASGANISLTTSPESAVKDASCIITDSWVSMHDKDGERRHNALAAYQVNRRLMAHAKKNAIFMHCLPAHRNEEVTDEVMDGPQSVIFDEAENRLHAQKSILLHCLGKSS